MEECQVARKNKLLITPQEARAQEEEFKVARRKMRGWSEVKMQGKRRVSR